MERSPTDMAPVLIGQNGHIEETYHPRLFKVRFPGWPAPENPLVAREAHVREARHVLERVHALWYPVWVPPGCVGLHAVAEQLPCRGRPLPASHLGERGVHLGRR